MRSHQGCGAGSLGRGVPRGGRGLPAWLQGSALCVARCGQTSGIRSVWSWVAGSMPGLGLCWAPVWLRGLAMSLGASPGRTSSLWQGELVVIQPAGAAGHVSGGPALSPVASQAPVCRRRVQRCCPCEWGTETAVSQSRNHAGLQQGPSTGRESRRCRRPGRRVGSRSRRQQEAPLLGAEDGDRGRWPCGPGPKWAAWRGSTQGALSGGPMAPALFLPCSSIPRNIGPSRTSHCSSAAPSEAGRWRRKDPSFPRSRMCRSTQGRRPHVCPERARYTPRAQCTRTTAGLPEEGPREGRPAAQR